LPFSIATFAISLGTSSWSERISPKLLIQAGIVFMIVGLLLFYSVVAVDIKISQMIIPLGVFGIGMGLLMAHLVNLILSSVDPNDSPEASAVNNTADQLGNSLGTAIVGSLLMAFFLGNVVDGALRFTGIEASPQERTQLVTLLEDAREVITDADPQELYNLLPSDIQQQLDKFLDASVVTAMEDTLLVIAGLLVIMFLLASFLPKKENRKVPLAERVPDMAGAE